MEIREINREERQLGRWQGGVVKRDRKRLFNRERERERND